MEREVPDIVKDLIVHEYTDWSYQQNIDNLKFKTMQIYSDINICIPWLETINYRTSAAKESITTYMYNFGVQPSKSLLPIPSWAKHAAHTYMSRSMTKPTKLSRRPAKTRISLCIRPVWSEYLLYAWRNLGSLATHSEDWSDWADALVMPKSDPRTDFSIRTPHSWKILIIQILQYRCRCSGLNIIPRVNSTYI